MIFLFLSSLFCFFDLFKFSLQLGFSFVLFGFVLINLSRALRLSKSTFDDFFVAGFFLVLLEFDLLILQHFRMFVCGLGLQLCSFFKKLLVFGIERFLILDLLQ